MSATHIKWNRNGLCGAACAQMVLHARKVIGSTPAEQEKLWNSIKDHTSGKSTATPQTPCSGVIPEVFNTMIREACGGSRVLCWCTYPTALRAALKASLGRNVTITLRKRASEVTANKAIKACLARAGLPIVLINGATHWVVVDGWDETASKPVSMLDPALDTPSAHTLDDWNTEFMSAVDCGNFDRKYVIVEIDP